MNPCSVWGDNRDPVSDASELPAKGECLLGGASLLYFPAVIVLVRGAGVRVGSKIVRVDVALVELGRDGGWTDVLQ